MISSIRYRKASTLTLFDNRFRSATFLLISFLLSFLAIGLARPQDSDDATSSISQVSTPFVDQTTGLTMERFFGARTSFAFAFALPASGSANATSATPSSFIGQLAFPLVNGQGWGAMGLTGDMEGNFILAVWPDGKGGVMASFRQAIDEDNPAEVRGSFAVRPIPDGTIVNQTFLSYTFLCEGCVDTSLGLKVQPSGNAAMGWALSERPPRGDPANPGAFLGFHERGFGPFTARLGNAATQQFDAVALTALQPVGASRNAVPVVAGGAGRGSKDKDDDDNNGNESDDDEDDDED